MRRLLVLRPEPGASATVARARVRGLEAVAVPLFEVEPIVWKLPEPRGFDGLLLTSANAVRHGGTGLEVLRGLPVYAVGAATADAATTAGFIVVETGESGVEALLKRMPPHMKLLHLCGEDRIVAEAAQEITTVPVYRARPVAPDLSLAKGSVALIHSPRAARRFAELVHERSGIAIVAISSAAAGAAGTGWESVEAASEPNDDALLALAEQLCNKPAPE